MKFDAAKKTEIIEALKRVGCNRHCPRCGNFSFTLLDGYTTIILAMELSGSLVLGGPQVPAVITACNQCGFISQHALGALGLLPPEGNTK